MLSRFMLIAVIGVLGCGGDDDGGEAIDGAPQVELTAEDILEMLLDVDGDGSGLDCDTVDGVDSADLARVTRRTVDVQPLSINVNGGGSNSPPFLGNAADQFIQFVFRVPPDAVPEQPIDVHLVGVTSGTPCGIVLAAQGMLYVGGGDIQPGSIEGGETVTISSSAYTPIKATIGPDAAGKMVPGDSIIISITRQGLDSSDTCPEGFVVNAAAVEYQGI